jgi:AraC-like DNA-binding protein
MNTSTVINKPMLFKAPHQDYQKWIKALGEYVKAKTYEDRIIYPADFADGYTKAKSIEPGLAYKIADYTLNRDIEYRLEPTKAAALQPYIMIHFYELSFEEKVYFKVGNTVMESNDQFYSVAIMTNNLTNQTLALKKATRVKGLSIQITGDWLKQNITDLTDSKMELLKQKECVIDFITAKQRKILNDVFTGAPGAHLPELFTKSRVLRLTEQFINNLCNNGLHTIPGYTNQKDFQGLLKVEHLLLKTYNEEFPSIVTLAKTAYMSESKLKKLFKKAYGMAPHEYYQKNRMHKAKELLRSRKHNITQVGIMLGYQNMSNFSLAFKKEFNYLPSQFEEVL